jgi:diguanylate cyclase (GGDEF)-like protein
MQNTVQVDPAWFERLAQLSMDLATVFDSERLPQRIMESFAEAAGVEKGSLMAPDESGERLEIRAALGVSEEARRAVRPRRGEGVAGRVWESGKPLLLEDAAGDRELYVDFYRGGARPKEALLALPLVYREEVLGVVNLDRKAGGGTFRRDEVVFLMVLCNLAAVAMANLRFYRESVTDGLTGLISQKTFQIRLREEFSRARRYSAFLSVLFLDLDHFKSFNDSHGHPLGDQALRHLARLLRESTRSIDVVGRCGGEEFGLLLLETDLLSARYVAERIRARVEATPLVSNGRGYPLSVSIGAAAFSPADSVLTSEGLLERADQALYRAKAEGRNRVALWEAAAAPEKPKSVRAGRGDRRLSPTSSSVDKIG